MAHIEVENEAFHRIAKKIAPEISNILEKILNSSNYQV